MIGWLAYCLVVASFVGLAALVAERALGALERPTRWAWVSGLAASVALPVWAWVAPGGGSSAGAFAPLPGAYVMDLVPLAVATDAGAGGGVLWSRIGWTEAGLLLWAAVSVTLLAWMAVSGWRMRRAARGWRREVVDGVEVLVSSRTGPAALGLGRGRVVVPEWALHLAPRQRRLLLLHESEHVRSADPQLVLAGLVLCSLMPWNVVLWWQLARLRLSIEVDCDARVLDRSGDVRGYGSLLLDVGQRRGARLAVALAESKSSLERRIRMITRERTGRRAVRAAGLTLVSLMVLAVACETPAPTGLSAPERSALSPAAALEGAADMGCEPMVYVDGRRLAGGLAEARATVDVAAIETVEVIRSPGARCGVVFVTMDDASAEARERQRAVVGELRAREAAADRPAASMEELAERPVFTPFTVRPQLTNRSEVQRALMSEYPPLLREAGIGGVANVWFLIGDDGEVAQVLLNASSGQPALDDAALRVARTMRFSPAYNRDQPVPVWVALDIRFEAAGAAEASERAGAAGRASVESAAATRAAAAEAAANEAAANEAAPTFTPMTERPRLVNEAEVRAALDSRYPPLLRNAGIEAAASVWLYIDETGAVTRTRINRTSGYGALDEAALDVARVMRFTPALNRDRTVPVWVALDIRFEGQGEPGT